MSRLSYLLLFGLATQLTGVRVNDDVEVQEDSISVDQALSGDEAACMASLQQVHGGFTLKRIFKPVLEGKYRLRNRYSGKYLSATEEGGQLYTTRTHLDKSSLSDWDIRRVKGVKGFPTFSMRNRKSHLYLAVENGALAMAKDAYPLFLETGPEGIYNAISNDEERTNWVIENTTTTRVAMGPKVGRGDEIFNWKAHWELELVGKPKGRWFPKGANGEYQFQWQQASLIPMFKGGTYTWADMCSEANQADVCPAGYADIRAYYLQIGRVQETGRNNIPTETTVRECDSSIGLDRQMYSLPGLIGELKGIAGESCAKFDLRNISRLMKQGIEEKCYSSCLTDLREAVKGYDCAASTADNWNKLGTQVFENARCALSPSTLVYLVDFVLQEKCWTFVKPSPMWMPTDNGPGVTNLARADGDAVCYVEEGKENWRSSEGIRQRGQCIEGTTCKCPSTWRKKYSTLAEKRQEDQASVRAVTPTDISARTQPNFFIADADLGFRAIINTMTRSFFMGSIVQMTVFAKTLGAALLAVPFGAPFIVQTGLATFGYVSNFAKFTCSSSVGCWPMEPKRMRTQEQSKACRLPKEAEQGGSPVWFMPPPGFTLYHRSWYHFRKCVLRYCSKSDMLAQRVEFGDGKRNVYNCQPLAFEDMTPAQQGNFTQILRKTIPSEYASLI